RPLLNASFGTVFVVAAALGAAATIFARRRQDAADRLWASLLGVSGGLLLVFLLATESSSYCRLAGAALGGGAGYQVLARTLLLAIWGLSAVAFLAAGLATGDALSRVASLGLYALAAAGAVSGIDSAFGILGNLHPEARSALFLNQIFLASLLA